MKERREECRNARSEGEGKCVHSCACAFPVGQGHDKRMARARCMNEAWVCMEAVHGAEEHLEHLLHLESKRTPGM